MEWYNSLKKPPLTPPNKVFGPVWGILYTMMAVSFVIFLRSKGAKWNGAALFLLQLALNLTWAPTFFTYHKICTSAFIIPLIIIATVYTIREFWKHNRIAAALLVPYVLWMCWATYLNVYVCVKNK